MNNASSAAESRQRVELRRPTTLRQIAFAILGLFTFVAMLANGAPPVLSAVSAVLACVIGWPRR